MDPIPGIVIDDAEGRNFCDDPFVFRINPPAPPAGIRVLDEPLPVVSDTAPIKLVVENAISALATAVNGGCIPLATTRTGDTLGIEDAGNPSGRPAVSVFCKNTFY